MKIFIPYPCMTSKKYHSIWSLCKATFTEHISDASFDSANGEVEAANGITSKAIAAALDDNRLRAEGLEDILE